MKTTKSTQETWNELILQWQSCLMNQINEAAGYIQQGNRKKADQKGTKNYFLTAIKKKKRTLKLKDSFTVWIVTAVLLKNLRLSIMN